MTTTLNEDEEQPSFRCPVCFRRSFNPNDILYGYCGACHAFTGGRSNEGG